MKNKLYRFTVNLGLFFIWISYIKDLLYIFLLDLDLKRSREKISQYIMLTMVLFVMKYTHKDWFMFLWSFCKPIWIFLNYATNVILNQSFKVRTQDEID